MITRRSLFGIFAGAVAAPIVVRSGLLMPIKALVAPPLEFNRLPSMVKYSGPTLTTEMGIFPVVGRLPPAGRAVTVYFDERSRLYRIAS